MKTYLVPVIHEYLIGDDVEVRANSPEEALALALKGEGHSNGMDWNRALLTETREMPGGGVTEVTP